MDSRFSRQSGIWLNTEGGHRFCEAVSTVDVGAQEIRPALTYVSQQYVPQAT